MASDLPIEFHTENIFVFTLKTLLFGLYNIAT